ncbi:tyrosine-type recombinase/integrase [Streptomyces sp. NPDC058603]|uniref:tyrosine-type recombinase/integrase n=1 Tax=Streptomyces sp. NPDC058603 TaxID=3346551 RepID=UPI003654072E
MENSFDVRIYAIETNKRAKGSSYTLRWKVATKKHSKTYTRFALADARRSELMSAQKKGQPFGIASGLPLSFASKAAKTNWYDFAIEYVDWKWKRSSANNRRNIAKAMTATTIALLRTPPKQFDGQQVRTALREWAFNTKRRAEAPDDVRVILDWIKRSTLSMDAWEDTEKVETVVGALGTRLDGTAAAASSVTRNSRIMNLVMGYAIKHGVLRANPLPKGKGEGSPPKVAQAIDKRSLLNPDQVAQLLAWIGERPRRGRLYRAFFATLYYAGLRPEEAVALRVSDARLPETGWGEFLVHQAQPEVGGQWTDTGEVHEERHLKGRAEGETRPVPIHPSLVALLHGIIAKYKLKPTDLLFPGEGGDMLAGSVFRRVWGKAREEVLPKHEYESPTGKRVYDLRHTCLTTWLNNGIPPAQVAEWAGNSVPILYAIYARCIVGQQAVLLKRIEGVQDLPTVEA